MYLKNSLLRLIRRFPIYFMRLYNVGGIIDKFYKRTVATSIERNKELVLRALAVCVERIFTVRFSWFQYILRFFRRSHINSIDIII